MLRVEFVAWLRGRETPPETRLLHAAGAARLGAVLRAEPFGTLVLPARPALLPGRALLRLLDKVIPNVF